MIYLNATLRYLGICTTCMTAQAVKLLEHKLFHLGLGCNKRQENKAVWFLTPLEMLSICLNRLYTHSSNFNYFTCIVLFSVM